MMKASINSLDIVVKHLRSHCYFYGVACFIIYSPINKSSVRESGKVKTGATEKMSTGVKAAIADSKGRGTPDHPGKMSNICLI